jgi:hypothetical protein
MPTTALALFAATLAGCHETTGPDEPFPSGLVTLEWHAKARDLIATNRLNALATGRVLAALAVAQQRAIVQVDGPNPPAGPLDRDRFEARRGAVAGASVQVLSSFFPDEAMAFEQLQTEQGNAETGQTHPQFAHGVAIGRAAGDAMIDHVQNDGFTAPWTGSVPVGSGLWVAATLPPGGAMLGGVKPYFLSSGSQFRPSLPPVYGSAAFATDLEEVVTLTKNITPAELEFARHWDFPLGSYTPIGFWNEAAATYIEEDGLDERAASGVFALTHAAVFDALIGCWEAKYHYWILRPSHADATISMAFPLPNFPSYPSGHSCASSAAARVLTSFFPARSNQLATWVDEAGLSRILAGIHYRFDITAGEELGIKVAEWAIARGTP